MIHSYFILRHWDLLIQPKRENIKQKILEYIETMKKFKINTLVFLRHFSHNKPMHAKHWRNFTRS